MSPVPLVTRSSTWPRLTRRTGFQSRIIDGLLSAIVRAGELESRCVLRHYLRRKLAPIAPPLRTSRVEPGAALRELERAPREANLHAPLELRALSPAVALAAI